VNRTCSPEWNSSFRRAAGDQLHLGTVFCWWDKLYRTLRRDILQNEITIGVAAYRDEKELPLAQLLVLPFRKQRAWRLPNGLEPDREPRPSHQLAE
jgi:hypothetical protein